MGAIQNAVSGIISGTSRMLSSYRNMQSRERTAAALEAKNKQDAEDRARLQARQDAHDQRESELNAAKVHYYESRAQVNEANAKAQASTQRRKNKESKAAIEISKQKADVQTKRAEIAAGKAQLERDKFDAKQARAQVADNAPQPVAPAAEELATPEPVEEQIIDTTPPAAKQSLAEKVAVVENTKAAKTPVHTGEQYPWPIYNLLPQGTVVPDIPEIPQEVKDAAAKAGGDYNKYYDSNKIKEFIAPYEQYLKREPIQPLSKPDWYRTEVDALADKESEALEQFQKVYTSRISSALKKGKVSDEFAESLKLTFEDGDYDYGPLIAVEDSLAGYKDGIKKYFKDGISEEDLREKQKELLRNIEGMTLSEDKIDAIVDASWAAYPPRDELQIIPNINKAFESGELTQSKMDELKATLARRMKRLNDAKLSTSAKKKKITTGGKK